MTSPAAFLRDVAGKILTGVRYLTARRPAAVVQGQRRRWHSVDATPLGAADAIKNDAMTCPQCATRLVRRAAQRDHREFLWGLLMVYPFRCQLCTHRFVRFHGRLTHNPQRDYQRMLVNYPVSFGPSVVESQDVRGEGILRNLSIRGCAIDSEVPVPHGASLYVRFEIGDRKTPVEVDRAAVRFATGTRIGVEFLELSPEHEARLRQVVETRLSSLPPLTGS